MTSRTPTVTPPRNGGGWYGQVPGNAHRAYGGVGVASGSRAWGPDPLPKALFLFPVPALAALVYLGTIEPYDPWPILSFLWMIWANDTGAYVVGKPLGRHKLWPAVSPGKSWEGTVGGMLASAGVAWAALGAEWWWLGALMGGLSTAGDLTQSAWKRRRGMKDSGTLLPGHGGIMDRFDGFLIAAPVYVLLWCIFAA